MTPECSELSDILHKESVAIAGASNDNSWAAVETAARALGDALRVKDGPGELHRSDSIGYSV